MPELPEVETTVRGLRKKVLSRTFVDFWTDFPKNIRLCQGFCGQVKRPFDNFAKEIKNRKILKIWRRGKNILFFLSGGKVLLVHQKMTGHLLLGKWKREKGKWNSEISGPLAKDPKNGFLHSIFFLDNKSQLALSDMRKFAKIELWDEKKLKDSENFQCLGPEPLEINFTFKKFKSILPKSGKIKQILMNQEVIAGIGNIYSNEILWEARIHPLRDVSKINASELEKIYKSIKNILKRAIALKGDSFSDYRMSDGREGGYQKVQNVYAREGGRCRRNDGGIIKRLKIGGRSAHFCPTCQK